jgi:chloramphenicol-sensitive protein RarD
LSPVSLAIIAYSWWGLVPIYWKFLAAFSAEELILYRILLSCLFLAPLAWHPRLAGSGMGAIWRHRRAMAGLTLAGILIGFNWYLYVWAVNHNRVLESSLGYFINPLVNVALGTLLLGEKMRPLQRWACAFAAAGALVLTWHTGEIPWVALLLAISFALYGLVRKVIHVSTVPGTFWETLLLSLPALLAFFFWPFPDSPLHLPHATGGELAILALCGVVTTVPLLAFAEAAKFLPLSVLGFFQFIAPSLQFLLGVLVYREPFSPVHSLAFALIWTGLAIFVRDLWARRKTKPGKGLRS